MASAELEEGDAGDLVDPTEALRFSASSLSAVLLKRSTYLHQWKRRPVVLKGLGDTSSLTFVKHNEETTMKLGGRALSVAVLESLRCREHGEIFPFSLLGSNGSTVVMLGCGSEARRAEWVHVLRAVLNGQTSWEELAIGQQRPPSPATEGNFGEAVVLPTAAADGPLAEGAITADEFVTRAGVSSRSSSTTSCSALASAPPHQRPSTQPPLAELFASSKPAGSADSPEAAAAAAEPAQTEPTAEAAGERWRLHEIEDGMRIFIEEQSLPARPQSTAALVLSMATADTIAAPLLVLAGALVFAAWNEPRAACALLCALAVALCLALVGALELRVRPHHAHVQRTGCVRATTAVQCSPELAFAVVMGMGEARFEWDAAYNGCRLVDSLDRHSDVLHLRFPALSLPPFFFAAPRDACVLRYWRQESESSYTVVYLPATHASCPPTAPGCVRAEVIGSAITIRAARPPPGKEAREGESGASPRGAYGRDGGGGGGRLGAGGHADSSCIVSHVLHLAPRGWLGHAWCASLRARYQLWVVRQLLPFRHFAEQQQAEESRDGFSEAQVIEDYLSGAGAWAAPDAQGLQGLRVADAGASVAGPGAAEGSGGGAAAGAVAAFGSAAAATGRAATSATLLEGALGGGGAQQLPAVLSAVSPLLRAASRPRASRRAANSPSAALLERLCSVRRARHPDDRHCWDEPEPQTFKLRGPTYLADKRKEPALEDSTLLQLVAVDLLRSAHTIEHVAARAGNPAQAENPANFVLVINLQLPGSPVHSNSSLVLYFSGQRRNAADAALMARLERFAAAESDEARSALLKLVPSVQEGNWIVRRAVGQTPVLLGKALCTAYHHVPGRYLEVDVDIGSSSVAAGVLRIVRGASRSLVVDLAFVLEGQSEDELPERPLACARLMCIDLDQATSMDAACTAHAAPDGLSYPQAAEPHFADEAAKPGLADGLSCPLEAAPAALAPASAPSSVSPLPLRPLSDATPAVEPPQEPLLACTGNRAYSSTVPDDFAYSGSPTSTMLSS